MLYVISYFTFLEATGNQLLVCSICLPLYISLLLQLSSLLSLVLIVSIVVADICVYFLISCVGIGVLIILKTVSGWRRRQFEENASASFLKQPNLCKKAVFYFFCSIAARYNDVQYKCWWILNPHCILFWSLFLNIFSFP